MKLTKMSDGRILLEVAGHAHALPAFAVAQLADQLGVIDRSSAEVAVIEAARSWKAKRDDDASLSRLGPPHIRSARVLYDAVAELEAKTA